MSQVFALIDFVPVSLDLFWGRLLKTSLLRSRKACRFVGYKSRSRQSLSEFNPFNIFSMVDRENQCKVHVSRKREKIHLTARPMPSTSFLQFVCLYTSTSQCNETKFTKMYCKQLCNWFCNCPFLPSIDQADIHC